MIRDHGERSGLGIFSQKVPVGLVLDLILLLKIIRIQDHTFIQDRSYYVIIQRTDGWREREKEQAEAPAAENRARRGATGRNRAPGAPQAGNGRYAAVPPPPPPGDGSNARDIRAARRAAWEQADQQQGGYWN